MFRTILLLFPVAFLLSFSPQNKRKKSAAAQQAATGGFGMDYRQLGAPIPPVRLVDTNGVVWNNDSLAGGGNLFVMFFNPTCGHCEDMTDALVKDASLRSGNKIVLVAGNNMGDYLGDFIRNHKLQSAPDMRVTLDNNQLIEKVYNYQPLPQVNVYSPDRKLIRVLSGISTTDSLRQYYR